MQFFRELKTCLKRTLRYARRPRPVEKVMKDGIYVFTVRF